MRFCSLLLCILQDFLKAITELLFCHRSYISFLIHRISNLQILHVQFKRLYKINNNIFNDNKPPCRNTALPCTEEAGLYCDLCSPVDICIFKHYKRVRPSQFQHEGFDHPSCNLSYFRSYSRTSGNRNSIHKIFVYDFYGSFSVYEQRLKYVLRQPGFSKDLLCLKSGSGYIGSMFKQAYISCNQCGHCKSENL
ncbi:hypothetical protein SDC9_178540 [bioreactor metagenome]|uniref:Uncharacterized protein n=1 Tax=bioreactor metagenome TaxID=1076179 RepID=A0A645GWJ6_9ZZZZ